MKEEKTEEMLVGIGRIKANKEKIDFLLELTGKAILQMPLNRKEKGVARETYADLLREAQTFLSQAKRVRRPKQLPLDKDAAKK